jgi:rhodanese-related sulfurtransferase
MSHSLAVTLRSVRPLCLVAVMILGLAGGCTKKTSDKDLVWVDPAEGATLVQGRPRLLGGGSDEPAGIWLDPRTEREYRSGHIPGAVHVPLLHDSARGQVEQYRDRKVIVVYGNGYNSPVAIAVSKKLIELEFKDVRTLRGGIQAWEAAGNPLTTGDDP